MDGTSIRLPSAPRTIVPMTDLPILYLTKEARVLSSDRELRRLRERGEMVRLGAGVYISTTDWETLEADEQYRTRARAIAFRAKSVPQFSHDTAAALWRLPTVGSWPHNLHQLSSRERPSSSRVDVSRHARGLDPHPEYIDGLEVTSLARTLVDMSCSTSFVRAVAMVDDGLRHARDGDPRWGWPTSSARRADLYRTLESLEPYTGSTRGRRVLDFATGLSGSPGESVARVQFHALGFPPPQLQVEFRDHRGLIGFADFYWPELDLIVEFDGESKYGNSRRYQRHLSDREVLYVEKDREDRMRRLVRSFARIDWRTTRDRRLLAERLREYGLIPGPRRIRQETDSALGIT
jgi:hypothetical protein